MRDIDEPIRIHCENCVYYGKECHGEICLLMVAFSGERREVSGDGHEEDAAGSGGE
jgi:hypothetical protein